MAHIGIIGLGVMGSAYAKNLIAGGVQVSGVDPALEARRLLSDLGGKAHASPGKWLADCDLVILALLSPGVLRAVCNDLSNLLAKGQVVVETGTFALADKKAARDMLAKHNIHLLDCPVSGTGKQAEMADILMMASGDKDAIAYARPFLNHCLLYTSPSPRDKRQSRMPSSA